MKFLLTSQGLSNKEIKNCFEQEVFRLENKKVAVLYTVKNPGDEQWLQYREQELDEFSLEYDFIDISKEKKVNPKLEEYGIIYVTGGNTFYVLDWLRRSGLCEFLSRAITEKRELLYVGLSAGSMAMGPNIKTAEIEGAGGDENDIGLKNLEGLGVIDWAIYPHYQTGEWGLLEDFFSSKGQPVIALTNEQAIFIDNKASGPIKLLGNSQVLTWGVEEGKIKKD
jgi:dipeptidase E